MPPEDERWKTIDAIPGWFNHESYCLWMELLQLQTQPGHLFEIGVLRGRSAAALEINRRESEQLILCDPHIPRKEMPPGLAAVGANPQHVKLLSCHSAALPKQKFYPQAREEFRWVHIDGEHTAEAAWKDLAVADHLLAWHGLVVIDDFFSVLYPQVTAAVYDYLRERPHSFKLVLAAFNKGYLCRPRAYAQYQGLLAQKVVDGMRGRGVNATLCKTSGMGDSTTFGMAENIDGGKLRGLDSDNGRMELIRNVWPSRE